MAGKKFPLQVIIEGIDKISAPMRKAQQSVENAFSPLHKLGQSIQGLGETVGLKRLNKAFGELQHGLGNIWNTMGSIARKLTFIVGGAAAAILGLVLHFSHAGEEIVKVSRKLGFAAESLQELRYAAKQWSVETDTFDQGMVIMQKGLGQAARGTGKLLSAFQALRISVRDANGHIRTADDLLPEIADKLNALDDEGKRTARTIEIFGRGGAQLTPLLRAGSKGIQELRDEARRLGLVMSGQTAEAGKEFSDSVLRVQSALFGMQVQLLGPILPALTRLADKLTAFLVDHQPAIRAFAESFAGALPARLERIGQLLQGLYNGVKPLIAVVEALGNTFGYTNVAMAATVLWIGTKMTVAIAQAIPAFVSFATVMLETVLPALWSVVSTLLGAVVPAFISAGIAIMTTPIGWIIAGIAAVIAIGVLLYKNWDAIAGFFVDAWDVIRDAFASAWDWISENWQLFLGPIGLVIKHWQRVKDFFVGLWDTVKDVFHRIVDFVRVKIEQLTSILPEWLRGKLGLSFTASGPAVMPRIGGGAAPVTRSEAAVTVKFENAPKGTRLVPQGNTGVDLDTSMGYAMLEAGA